VLGGGNAGSHGDPEDLMKVAEPGIVGAGQMGNGIAHVAALSGVHVVMRDLTDAFVRKGLEHGREEPAARCGTRGKMTASDRDVVLARDLAERRGSRTCPAAISS